MNSWNLKGPVVVWASKSGAVLPRRKEGITVSMRRGVLERYASLNGSDSRVKIK